MKTVRVILLLVVAFFGARAAIAAEAFIAPKLSGHMNDYAGMFSDSTKAALEKHLSMYEDSTTTQIVILTTKDLQDMEVSDYAVRVASEWKIGQKNIDNGIVIVLNPETHDFWITVGYGLEGIVTDLWSGRIFEHVAVPLLKEGKNDEAITAVVDSLTNYLTWSPLPEFKQRYADMQARRNEKTRATMWMTAIIVSVLTVVGFIIGYMNQKRQRRLTAQDRMQSAENLQQRFTLAIDTLGSAIDQMADYVTDSRLEKMKSTAVCSQDDVGTGVESLKSLALDHPDYAKWSMEYASVEARVFVIEQMSEAVLGARETSCTFADRLEKTSVMLREVGEAVEKKNVNTARISAYDSERQKFEALKESTPTRMANAKAFDYLEAAEVLSGIISRLMSIKRGAIDDITPKVIDSSNYSGGSKTTYTSSPSFSSPSSFGGGGGRFGGAGGGGKW